MGGFDSHSRCQNRKEAKMLLIDKLREDFLQYRKDRNEDASKLLSLVISEADKVGKDDGDRKPTDEEVVRIVKKMINANQEVIDLLEPAIGGDGEEGRNLFIRENEILKPYVPQQMTEEEIREAVDLIIVEEGLEDMKSLGLIMSTMKREHTGLYDGKIASTTARNILVENAKIRKEIEESEKG